MRLGDLDALKEDFDCVGFNDYDDYNRALRIIDNAQTVEVPENAVNCVLTMFGECSYNKTGCHDCEIKVKIRKALEERPQGEWGEWINLDLAKRVIAKFIGYLDEDMIERIQIALEKESKAYMKGEEE